MPSETFDSSIPIESEVTHREYGRYLDSRGSHMPDVMLGYENGLPVRLQTETRSYDVTASMETVSADKFFSHEIIRNKDGDMVSVKFDNPQAALFFKKVTKIYINEASRYLKESAEDELFMLRAEKPGIPPSGLKNSFERALLSDPTYAGETRDPVSLKQLMHNTIDITHCMINEEIDRHFPSGSLKDKTDSNVVDLPVNNGFHYLAQEVLEWIEGLQTTGVEVTTKQTQINFGQRPFVIHDVQLGSVETKPEQTFYLEKEVARVALFTADSFNMPPPRELFLYNVALFEEERQKGYWVSNLQRFIAASAIRTGNTIIISNHADLLVDSSAYSQEENVASMTGHHHIPAFVAGRSVRHETAHLVDSNGKEATITQSEGFADSIDGGFSFANATRVLRRAASYERDITPERIQYIFSKEARGISPVEIYAVSATFYCWLYEKLGPTSFGIFYRRLTGGYSASFGTTSERLEYELEMKQQGKKYAGDVVKCLDSLPRDHRWTWNNSQELMAEYANDVNGKKEVRDSAVTTIANP